MWSSSKFSCRQNGLFVSGIPFTSQSLEARQFPFAIEVAEDLDSQGKSRSVQPSLQRLVVMPYCPMWTGVVLAFHRFSLHCCSTPLTRFPLPSPFHPPSSPLGPEASHNPPLPPRTSTVRSQVVQRVHGPR